MLVRLLTLAISRLAGFVATIPVPLFLRGAIWQFVAARLGANLAEAALPVSDYRNFQAFFTRRLKPGLQPIAQAPKAWISPADSLWLSHVPCQGDDFVPAKNNRHRISKLLAGLGPSAERPWPQATVSTFYLRPKDYHRVHAPCDLEIDAVQLVPGRLWPVNAWGQRLTGLFANNERLVLRGRHGDRRVFVVFVGALMVGSIELSHTGLSDWKSGSTAAHVKKGEELGMFRFGSTVIVVVDHWIDANFMAAKEVRMGHEIFQF